MAIVHLDREQGFALLEEMTSARNLLAYGIRVVRTGPFIDTTRDPILTMLSIGMEKLYKLTLGLIELDRNHKWLTKDETKSWYHDLVRMHGKVMGELRIRTADKSPHVRGLLDDVDADPVVVPIIEALDMYGRMGRFYYLDRLGDHVQPISPYEFWQNIEQAALSDPEVAGLCQDAMRDVSDGDAWDRFIGTLHERIASAIERVWIAVAVCGRNHALGETGTTFGFEVHPDAVGRQ